MGPADAHIGIVVNGKAGTQMASFASLSNTDLAAVITYQRNAFGNSGSIVQPKTVNDAR